MNEEVDFVLELTNEKMKAAIAHLDKELLHIRAGKASPAMLDGIMIEYYGSLTPLIQVANVSTPDARTVTIQPWEKGLIPTIEKAIMNANLGFNPDNNGELIRINVPVLTEERRKDLAKIAKKLAEEAKVSVRNARQDSLKDIKKAKDEKEITEDDVKSYETDLQKLVDDANKKIDEMTKKKEEDIMKV